MVSEDTGIITLRIVNNTGHKLISGFPEGRRMWLNVKFYDAGNALIGEIKPYSPLVVSTDAQGNKQYVSGGIPTLVNCEGQEVESAAYSPPVCAVPTR